MDISDFYSGSTLSGAASGALPGLMMGNPYLAIGGGLVGGYMGMQAGEKRDQATAQQLASLKQIQASMDALASSSYGKYMEGLQKATSYYGPSMQRWNYLYSTGDKSGDFKLPTK